MSLKNLIAALGLSLGLCAGSQASLVTFDSLGDNDTLYFQALVDGAALNTSVGFTLTSLGTGTATFAVHVVNASSGAGQNSFMSFGIDVVNPSLSGASASGDWSANTNVVLPGLQKVDLCVYSALLCAGGGIWNGLDEGGVSDFTLTLTTAGNFLLDGISFVSPYGAKWQGVGTSGESYESSAGCFASQGCGPSNNVPEPTTLALAGLGLLGAAMARRRRA